MRRMPSQMRPLLLLHQLPRLRRRKPQKRKPRLRLMRLLRRRKPLKLIRRKLLKLERRLRKRSKKLLMMDPRKIQLLLRASLTRLLLIRRVRASLRRRLMVIRKPMVRRKRVRKCQPQRRCTSLSQRSTRRKLIQTPPTCEPLSTTERMLRKPLCEISAEMDNNRCLEC